MRSPIIALLPIIAGSLRAPNAVGPPPTRRVAVLSRRAVLTAPLPIALLCTPRRTTAATVCSCPNGPESCVCVEKELQKDKRRADAAGRDAIQSKAEIQALRAELAAEEEAAGRKPGPDTRDVGREKQRRAAAVPKREQQPMQADTPVEPGFLGLTGGSSQNYGDIDKDGAEARFQAIVAETARKREADFGFELDADDIRQIEEVLRPKYCGPSGLIGPCLTSSPKLKKKK